MISDAGEKDEAFRTARAALTKSGTSTLELALAGVPMVAAYKVSLIEELAARLLVNVPSVILANLVLGENVVPEFLQRDCTADRLAKARFHCWAIRRSGGGRSRRSRAWTPSWRSAKAIRVIERRR